MNSSFPSKVSVNDTISREGALFIMLKSIILRPRCFFSPMIVSQKSVSLKPRYVMMTYAPMSC